jgi:hypothetical protein
VLAVVLKKKEEAAARTGGVNSERESAGRRMHTNDFGTLPRGF